MKTRFRRLSTLEFEELCDLFAKCGQGDVLDFIHYIQETARKNRWSEELVKEIMWRAPGPEIELSSTP